MTNIKFTHEKRNNHPPWTVLSIKYLGDVYSIVNYNNGYKYTLNGFKIQPASLPKCKSIRYLQNCYRKVCQDIKYGIQHPEDSIFAIIKEKVDKFNGENQ